MIKSFITAILCPWKRNVVSPVFFDLRNGVCHLPAPYQVPADIFLICDAVTSFRLFERLPHSPSPLLTSKHVPQALLCQVFPDGWNRPTFFFSHVASPRLCNIIYRFNMYSGKNQCTSMNFLNCEITGKKMFIFFRFSLYRLFLSFYFLHLCNRLFNCYTNRARQ